MSKILLATADRRSPGKVIRQRIGPGIETGHRGRPDEREIVPGEDDDNVVFMSAEVLTRADGLGLTQGESIRNRSAPGLDRAAVHTFA
jgi:hypothetical protein